LDAEITIYRGSGDAFQSLAADAADFVLGAPTLAAAGRVRGANAVVVALGNALPLGWHLVAKRESTAQSVKDLDGKKVGITGSGSVSDLLARYAAQQDNIRFDLVPLGGGVVPNLRAGNVDAIILWSTLSYQLLQTGEVKSLSDFATTVRPTAFDTWIASEKLVKEKPAVVQKTLNALFGAVTAMHEDRAFAVKLIAENNEIPESVAVLEYERTILKLPRDGVVTPEMVGGYLELAKLIGMNDLAPAATITDGRFRPTPTK
jgi:NitT/TauT family transport system substrate-binding protein